MSRSRAAGSLIYRLCARGGPDATEGASGGWDPAPSSAAPSKKGPLTRPQVAESGGFPSRHASHDAPAAAMADPGRPGGGPLEGRPAASFATRLVAHGLAFADSHPPLPATKKGRHVAAQCGGEWGIRTPGPSYYRDFRLAGEPVRPLRQLSEPPRLPGPGPGLKGTCGPGRAPPMMEGHGGMAERFKAPVLKTGEGQPSVGSNPTPTAKKP